MHARPITIAGHIMYASPIALFEQVCQFIRLRRGRPFAVLREDLRRDNGPWKIGLWCRPYPRLPFAVCYDDDAKV
jgi:hypothetical protein